MYRSGETSCWISAMGNRGASASGPTGSRVPGCSGGGGGEGRSGTTLYHCRGSSDSCRTYLTWLSMDASGGQGGNVINATLVHLPAPGYIRLLAEAATESQPSPASAGPGRTVHLAPAERLVPDAHLRRAEPRQRLAVWSGARSWIPLLFEYR